MIDELIIQARNGDKHSLDMLHVRFVGCIESVCNRVYGIFAHKIPRGDLIDEATTIFYHLTLDEYIINGKARFPHYIKKMLYARLIHEFRPIYRGKKYDVPLEEHRIRLNVSPAVWRRERTTVIYKLLKYTEDNFTKRECDFIEKCILGKSNKAELAKKYGITQARASQIHNRIISKMRAKLLEMGIKKGDL